MKWYEESKIQGSLFDSSNDTLALTISLSLYTFRLDILKRDRVAADVVLKKNNDLRDAFVGRIIIHYHSWDGSLFDVARYFTVRRKGRMLSFDFEGGLRINAEADLKLGQHKFMTYYRAYDYYRVDEDDAHEIARRLIDRIIEYTNARDERMNKALGNIVYEKTGVDFDIRNTNVVDKKCTAKN